MFLLVLAVPALLVVLVGYVLGHAAWAWLTPFSSGAEPAGWITGVLLLVATVRLVVVRRRRPGR
jgi:MYXO-CTERM domain-containing protein